MRLDAKLKEFRQQITPNWVFQLFEECIKDFMGGIRDKLVEEMRNSNMIGQKTPERRYSMDDYFLIDRVFSKSYYSHGFSNELFHHCSKYMSDSRYE